MLKTWFCVTAGRYANWRLGHGYFFGSFIYFMEVVVALLLLALAIEFITVLTGGAAKADICSRIEAFNDTQPRATMRRLPCHCIPLANRAEAVAINGKSPPGYSCGGNGTSYDKHCNLGAPCHKEEAK